MSSGTRNQGQQSQGRQDTSYSTGYGGSGQDQQGSSYSQDYGVSDLKKPEQAHLSKENEASVQRKDPKATNSENRGQGAPYAGVSEADMQKDAEYCAKMAAAEVQRQERLRKEAAITAAENEIKAQTHFLANRY